MCAQLYKKCTIKYYSIWAKSSQAWLKNELIQQQQLRKKNENLHIKFNKQFMCGSYAILLFW